MTDSNADVCQQAKDWAADYLAGCVSKGRYGRKNGHGFYDYE